MSTEFPRTLKIVTVWLVIGTAIFLAVQAWQAQQKRSLFQASSDAIELKRGLLRSGRACPSRGAAPR